MIQKIQNNEYLKRVDNMTSAEKDEYMKRVGEWLQEQAPVLVQKTEEDGARFLNVIQCSASWNDAECQAWMDGVRLLTALAPTTETWLPDMLYLKAAKRCIKRMIDLLNGLLDEAKAVETHHVSDISTDGKHAKGEQEKHAAEEPLKAESQEDSVQTEPVRPKHIDQYVHLLPLKTQERAANVKGLLRDLETAREKMQLLMDDPQASDDARAQWAKTATRLDEKVKSIYKELDAEWSKLVKEGRVVVDDLGNAHVVEMRNEKGEMRNDDAAALSSDAERQPSDINPQPSLTSEQKTRRRELRKWLTDTRRGNGDTRAEHVKKWQENFKEYLTLEPREVAMKDEKILAAIKHYEIKMEDV